MYYWSCLFSGCTWLVMLVSIRLIKLLLTESTYLFKIPFRQQWTLVWVRGERSGGMKWVSDLQPVSAIFSSRLLHIGNDIEQSRIVHTSIFLKFCSRIEVTIYLYTEAGRWFSLPLNVYCAKSCKPIIFCSSLPCGIQGRGTQNRMPMSSSCSSAILH